MKIITAILFFITMRAQATLPGCTDGGAPLYLQIPNYGASGDQWSNALKFDFNVLSTTTLTIPLLQTSTVTVSQLFVKNGANISTITPTGFYGTYYGTAGNISGVVKTTGDMMTGPLVIYSSITTRSILVNDASYPKLVFQGQIGAGGELDFKQSSDSALVNSWSLWHDVGAGNLLRLSNLSGIVQSWDQNGRTEISNAYTPPAYALDVTGGGHFTSTVTASEFFGSGAGLTAIAGTALDGSNITTSSLTVTGSAFSVGASTLVVTNGKVGIGVTPSDDFVIQGPPAFLTVRNSANSNQTIFQMSSVANSGRLLSYTSGNTAWLDLSGDPGVPSYLLSHYFGIGTTSPTSKLVVSSGAISNDGSGAGITTTGNVGVGTPTPGAKLEIAADSTVGPSNYLVKISSQNGNVLWGITGAGHEILDGGGVSLGTCTNGTLDTNSSFSGMTVTFSGTNTTCSITLASPAPGDIACWTSGISTALTRPVLTSETTTGLTFVPVSGNFASGDKVHVFCRSLLAP